MPMLSSIVVNADRAAASLEMAAAGLDEAIVALSPFAQAAAQTARLREVRAAIMRDVGSMRAAITAHDDYVCEMMAAAIQADFERAERIHLSPPPPFRVVK